MSGPAILAFGHSSRVGKDTCAEAVATVCERRGLKVLRVAFADALKLHCYLLFADFGLHEAAYYETHPEARTQVLPEVGKTPVQIWIEVGNALREVWAPIWIRHALGGIEGFDLVVISDLRFENEAKAVLALGGHLVRVDRPGAEVHGSDRMLGPLTPWSAVVRNETTIDDLRVAAVRVAVQMFPQLYPSVDSH